MELMTAKEAASKAQDVESKVHNDQLLLAKVAIEKAVATGKLMAYIYFYPAEPVILKLQSLGYTVSSINARNETTTTISWNPKETYSNGGYR